MKCPICEKNINNEYYDYMDSVMMEHHASCKDEFHEYKYVYVHGNTEESFGRVSFTNHHKDSSEISNLVESQFQLALKLEKAVYMRNIKEKADG